METKLWNQVLRALETKPKISNWVLETVGGCRCEAGVTSKPRGIK